VLLSQARRGTTPSRRKFVCAENRGLLVGTLKNLQVQIAKHPN